MSSLYALLCFSFCSSSGKKATEDNEVAIKKDSVTDSCTINGTRFVVYQRDSLAYIKAFGKQDTIYGELQLRAPVYFVRAHQSEKVLHYAYPQFQVNQVLMLFGNKADSAMLEARGLAPDLWCGTHIQGLLLKNGQALLTKKLHDGIKCKGFSSDEKDFYSLASER